MVLIFKQLIFQLLLVYFLVKNPSNVLLIIILSLFLLFLLNIKNKLFLGNSGSYLIAFIISYFLITNYNKNVITSLRKYLFY